MHVKTASVVIVLVTVLLLAQTVSIVEAHHKPKDKGEIRKTAEKKSEDFDKDKKIKYDEKRKAFKAYKVAFKAWKIAKESWKTAKISGDQTVIDAKKVILDAAKIIKDKALKEYQDGKKKKIR